MNQEKGKDYKEDTGIGKSKKRSLEVLAPGGSLEGLKAAVNAGADAIYMGGQRFGARAFAQNPDETELLEAIDYCHLHGRKLYLTVNTLLKESELERELYEYLLPVYEHGLDAVLVQDFGVFSFLRRNFPEMPLHASTQMTLMGVYGARLLKRMGAERIVPSRELTLEELRIIHQQVDIEIECFVHGALCYCYSGQCLMSSMIGGRSGNRGRCAQPCRLAYDLYRGRERLNSPDSRYLLSLKDICTLQTLPELIEAGVCSFKIEGRMKRAEYAAGVTEIYRKYIDLYQNGGREHYRVDPEDERILMDLYNRGGFSAGYYHRYHGKIMMSMERPNHRGTPAAKVTAWKGGRLQLKALEPLWEKDALELEANAQAGAGNTGREILLRENVPQGKQFWLEPSGPKRASGGQMPKGIGMDTVLARVRCEHLLQELQEKYEKKETREKIEGRFVLKAGAGAVLTVKWKSRERTKTVTVTGEQPSLAKSRPLDRETLERQLRKTGNTPFLFDTLEMELEDGLFYPLQSLNELRRRALEELQESIRKDFRRCPTEKRDSNGRQSFLLEGTDRPALSASVETFEQLEAVSREPDISLVYADCCMFLSGPPEEGKRDFRIWAERIHGSGKRCILALPAVWRAQTICTFEHVFTQEVVSLADGFLLRSNEQLAYFRTYLDGKGSSGKEMIADAGIYTYNKEARQFLAELGITMDTLPLECNRTELRQRGCTGSECIVYGYLPLMVTAQCLIKNTEGCRHTPGLSWLKDRKGAEFPVKNFCPVCTNVIYNSVPLDLIPCGREIRELAPSSVRLAFTLEDAGEVHRIAAAAADCFLRGKETDKAVPEGTRGHFKRGVE
ncbi:MAG: U32 family peptidase [Lachnospiraceae bacterium]|nr:U32 family peptidase [Lachnospiraceae bacterium]